MTDKKDLPKVEKENIFVDPEVIRSIYEELGTFSIELDENPIEFGPRRLTGKVAQTRNLLSKCQKLFMMVSRFLWEVKRAITRDEVIIQMKTNDLLSTDQIVRSRPSVSDRKAMVQLLLVEEIKILEEKRENFINLQMLSDTLKAKNKDLIDTQTRLNSQIRLCKMEMESLGVKWGSKDPEVSLKLKPDSSTSGLKIDDFLETGDEEEEELQLPPRQELEKEVVEEEPIITPDTEEEIEPKVMSLSEVASSNPSKPNLADLAKDSLGIDLNSVSKVTREGDELHDLINGEVESSDDEVDGIIDLLEPPKHPEEPEEREVEEDDLDDILNQL